MTRKKKGIFNVHEEFTGKWKKQQTFIASNYNFRKNEVSGITEFQKIKSGKIISEYQMLTDTDVNDIAFNLEQDESDYSLPKLNAFINTSLMSPPYNIIEDYLYGLPEWTGETDHIKELAATVETDDDEFFYDVLKRFLVGAVDCLINHKSNDITLILQGAQGLGKTRWMRKLMPDNLLEDLYHESPIDTRNKEHDELLSTKWFIVLDELEAMRSNEISALKAFVTKTQISHRKVHGHRVSKFPRRASFLGNVNDPEFLSDTTGNRRWLAFRTLKIDYNHKINIGNVYAQALHLLQSGTFRHWFNKAEIKQFRIKSKEEELLLQNFDFPEDENGHGEWMSSTNVLEHLSYLNNKTNSNLNNRVMGRAIMKHCNYIDPRAKKSKSITKKYYLVKKNSNY